MSRLRPTLAVLAVVGALLVITAPALAATSTVRMTEASERYHFTPPTITIAVGGSVRWRNTTDAAHTVTSDSGGELGSSSVGDGATYSHTFSTAGTFSYHCTIHPYMKGKVVVLAAGSAPPPTDTDTAPASEPWAPPAALLLLAFVAPGLVLAGRRARR